MPVRYPFVLPADALLTSNKRQPHWAVTHRRTKDLRERGYLAGRQVPRVRMTRAHLYVVVTWPALRRRRDAANLWPTVKPLVDGLVDAGVLPDDDDTHLTGPDWRVTDGVAPDRHVIITLVFAPAQPMP